MIKLIENFNEYDTSDFEQDVFFQRIRSEFNVSSSFNDSLFYVSCNDVCIDAFISKVDGNITLSALDNAPFEELSEFFNIIGYSVILCEKKFSHFFHGEECSGSVMKNDVSVQIFHETDVLCSENLRDVYKLVSRTFDTKHDFMFWFADMSHKLRHGAAHVCGIYENSELISCGFSLFETADSAVISSVATEKTFRTKGFGSEVVKRLLSLNEGKSVYVFIENENLKSWYSKLGFAEYKNWSEIKNVL